MSIPTSYTVRSAAGACWISSEPAHTGTQHTQPLAAVVVMIARAVDLNGHDITPRVAGTIRDALASMGGDLS